NAGRSGVFVPFFGRPASTHRGAALLAIRTGAPLFLAYLRRAGAGYEGFVEPVTAERGGDLDAAVERLTAAFTRALEAAIRQSPEQYFWHHRRWKTAPPAPVESLDDRSAATRGSRAERGGAATV